MKDCCLQSFTKAAVLLSCVPTNQVGLGLYALAGFNWLLAYLYQSKCPLRLCISIAVAVSIGRARLAVVMQGGILSIDCALDNDNLLATAGADAAVVVFDREASRIRATLTGHSKKVNGEHLLK